MVPVAVFTGWPPSRLVGRIVWRPLGRTAGEEGAQEPQPVDGDGVLGALEAAPDRRRRGDDLVVGGERLDADRAGVADVGEGVAHGDPVDVVVARCAAVVAAHLDVGEVVAGGA